jgi:hypothetical protein
LAATWQQRPFLVQLDPKLDPRLYEPFSGTLLSHGLLRSASLTRLQILGVTHVLNNVFRHHLALKASGALSNDSPSCSRTSAIFIAPSQQDIRHIGTYFLCATLRRTVALLCCRSSAEIEDRASSSSPYGAVISSFRWGALQLFGNLMMRVSVNLVQIEVLPTSSVQFFEGVTQYNAINRPLNSGFQTRIHDRVLTFKKIRGHVVLHHFVVPHSKTAKADSASKLGN